MIKNKKNVLNKLFDEASNYADGGEGMTSITTLDSLSNDDYDINHNYSLPPTNLDKYITHVFMEQGPNEEDPNMAGGGDPNMDGADPSMGGGGGDPNMGMDPSMDPSMGGDPNAMGGAAGGMGDESMERSQSPREIGRRYELKRIYARLVSVESYLSSSSDYSLQRLRNYVSQAIDLFKLLINNISYYQDKIDEIIIMYYNFIEDVYEILRRYFVFRSEQIKKIS